MKKSAQAMPLFQQRPLFKRSQAGISLIELMIAITLGLILVAGVTGLIVQQSSARAELEKSTRQIENGRYAMQVLQQDIQHAGFYGDYSPPVAAPDTSFAAFTTPAPCETTPANLGWRTSPLEVPVAIYGISDSGATPSCVTNRQANTDILVIRRVETKTVAAASPVTGETYLQVSSCGSEFGTTPFVLGAGGFTLKKKDCTTLADLWKYVVHIYYISSCNQCGSDTIPTLKMVEFVNGSMSIVPIAEGIENLQFDYGIDTLKKGSPVSYSAAPAAADWENVVAIRVNLLARTIEATPSFTTNKTYYLGSAGAVGPYTDHFKRQVFSQLVRANNPSGRREQ